MLHRTCPSFVSAQTLFKPTHTCSSRHGAVVGDCAGGATSIQADPAETSSKTSNVKISRNVAVTSTTPGLNFQNSRLKRKRDAVSLSNKGI